MNNTYIPSDNELLKSRGGIIAYIPGNNRKQILTKLDANFIGLSDEEISDLIETELKIDLDTEEGLKKVNDIFLKGVKRAKKQRGQITKRYNNIRFQTKEDVLKFCKDTNIRTKKGNPTMSAKTNCYILKQVGIVNNILSNKEVQDLEKRSEYLIKILQENLQIEKIDKYTYRGFFTFYNKNNKPETIDFILKIRSKTDESIESKVARDPKYDTAEKLKDGIALSFHTRNKASSIILMQFLSEIMYYEEDIEGCISKNKYEIEKCDLRQRSNFDIKNKNSLFGNDLSKISEEYHINKTFLEYLFEIAIEDKKDLKEKLKKMKDKGESANYGDIKIITRVGIPLLEDLQKQNAVLYPVGLEMKFLSYDTGNDDGLNWHPIYGSVRKLVEKIRLDKIDNEGFLTDKDIRKVVEELFLSLDFEIEKKNKLLLPGKQKDKNTILKEIYDELISKGYIDKKKIKQERIYIKSIKDGLVKYIKEERGLIKVKVEGRKGLFYTNQRGYDLGLIGKNPKMEKVD